MPTLHAHFVNDAFSIGLHTTGETHSTLVTSHCKREHVCCTLCPEPSEFNKEIFYKDFLALQRHCQLSHHVCTFCPIGASAFGTAKELSNHFRSKHGCDPPAVTSPNENITEKYLVVDATAREEPTVGDCRDLPRAQQATTRRPIVKAKAKKIVDQDDYDSPLFKQGRPSRRSKGKPANTQNCVKGKSEQNPKNRFHVLQSESDSN
ncbi:MAG: uncharacterized protein KVP18_002781 [Porospora cf. gigantea A]|uniref:uncharacterized protein n=1 Tax=Porospora cf. gigantea A TaxID=2853593 RepID=UPI00355A36AF|nr:MAG: hypothetical protein KVP18_002781 [Porospora cf. gigantea A]